MVDDRDAQLYEFSKNFTSARKNVVLKKQITELKSSFHE